MKFAFTMDIMPLFSLSIDHSKQLREHFTFIIFNQINEVLSAKFVKKTNNSLNV